MDLQAFSPAMRKHVRTTLEGYDAFIPPKLPPEIDVTWQLVSRLSEADRALSHLAGVAGTLANPHQLISPFIRREAVLSSRIEGTQASLSDLFTYEAAAEARLRSGKGTDDVREVLNYVEALDYGLERIESLPISSRLIREMHERLMRDVRGGEATPGLFRTSQNWIGPPGCLLKDATYVPPPAHEMQHALEDLEKFIHSQSEMPPLVRMALVHYQFEAIHPFLDGNGRIGRLLLVMLMCSTGLLPAPLLYLSAYFESNRTEYYRRLLAVSQRGEWGAWIHFFLIAVATQSNDAVDRSHRLLDLQQSYRKHLLSGRVSNSVLRVVDHLFTNPVITSGSVGTLLQSTPRTAQLTIEKLIENGIIREITGKQRNRLYMAEEIVAVVDAPTI